MTKCTRSSAGTQSRRSGGRSIGVWQTTDGVFSGDTSRPVPCGSVVLTPTIRADSHADALAFYQRLREANRALRCDFFEGLVMKRPDSIYPVQLRSMTEEFRGWVKHRFLA